MLVVRNYMLYGLEFVEVIMVGYYKLIIGEKGIGVNFFNVSDYRFTLGFKGFRIMT